MIEIICLVEGFTEERFVQLTLGPWLARQSNATRCLRPTIVKNSPHHRGGHGHDWNLIHKHLLTLLRHPRAIVTTMFDFYAFPPNLPGAPPPPLTSLDARVENIQRRMDAAIGHDRFIPGVLVHEFEGLLFTDPDLIVRHSVAPNLQNRTKRALDDIKQEFGSPENINGGEMTAPSKRLLAVINDWKKSVHGPRVADAITIERIRQECLHFDAWIKRLLAV